MCSRINGQGGLGLSKNPQWTSGNRQRPDRIVVGEVRGPEAFDMLMALNAGCSGMATLHANSAMDALEKLVSYSVLAGQNVAIPFVRRTVASVIDVVVFLRRTGRQRIVEEIATVPDDLDQDAFTLKTMFRHGDGHLDQAGWWS